MEFPKVTSLPMLRPAQLRPAEGDAAPGAQPGSFLDFLHKAMDSVNQAQVQADQAATALAAGQIQDLSQVTIAAEKAALMLQLTVEVRNKVLDAYQELMRMPL
jgi:flagellar hook-basal body complex protein FliE